MKKILWINDENVSENIVNLYKKNDLHLEVILIKSLSNLSKLSLTDYAVIISDYIIKESNFNGLDIFLQLINSGYTKYFIMKSAGFPPDNYKLLFDDTIYFWLNEPSAVLIKRIKNILSSNKLYDVELIETAELIRKMNGFKLNYLNLFDYELNHQFKQYNNEEKIQIIQWCCSRFNINLEKPIVLKNISALAETIYFKIKDRVKQKIYLYSPYNNKIHKINKVISILEDLYYEVECIKSENIITDESKLVIYYCGSTKLQKMFDSKLNKNLIYWFEESKEQLSIIDFLNLKDNTFINQNTLQNRLSLDQLIQKNIN
jgi:hypothetical protein